MKGILYSILTLGLILLSSCSNVKPKYEEIRYSKGDFVRYSIPMFYRHECNGKGTIQDYTYDENGHVLYTIITNSYCPLVLHTLQSNIVLYE